MIRRLLVLISVLAVAWWIYRWPNQAHTPESSLSSAQTTASEPSEEGDTPRVARAQEVKASTPARSAADVEELLSSDDGRAIALAGDVAELLEKASDRAKLLRSAAMITEAASRCILAGGCRDPRDPDRAYYDPTKGHVFQALANALALLQAAQIDGVMAPAVPAETLIGNLAIPEPNVQLTSLELAMASGNLDGAGWAAVLDHAPEVEGSAKPMYFALLQRGAPPEIHDAVVATLSRSLAGDGAATVIQVLRGFERLKLSEAEFKQAERSLCPMIRTDDPSGNSRAAVHYLQSYAAARGYSASPTEDCGGA